MVTLKDAVKAAEARYSPETWEAMTPKERTESIYQEMRRLDSEEIDGADVSLRFA